MRAPGYRRNPARDDIIISTLTIPLYLAAAGRYGVRIFAALALSLAVGLLTEIIGARIRKKKMLLPGLACWMLIPLVLPPVFPLWMTAASVFFAALIGVVFFGGYGRQLASPVALAWTFAVLSYPRSFGFGWSMPFTGYLSGFGRQIAAVLIIDHPLEFASAQPSVLLADILKGNLPQTPGSAVPIVLIAAGILLYLLRAVDIRSSLVFILATAIPAAILHRAAPGSFDPPSALLIGNFLLAALFVYPDRRISPRTRGGRYATAILAGIIAVLIRSYSSFPCGVFFAVLFANVFSPIIDEGFMWAAYGRKKR